ncbi:hypothetical protein D3C87_278490 [compost metagenome]
MSIFSFEVTPVYIFILLGIAVLLFHIGYLMRKEQKRKELLTQTINNMIRLGMKPHDADRMVSFYLTNEEMEDENQAFSLVYHKMKLNQDFRPGQFFNGEMPRDVTDYYVRQAKLEGPKSKFYTTA